MNVPQKLIATVKEHQRKILVEQLQLEAALKKEGYIFGTNENGEGVYAVHPDYYKQWLDETYQHFPELAVVRIW